METRHHLRERLKRLRLPGISDNLEMRIDQAQQNKLGYGEFLSLLVQDELLSRKANNVEKKLRVAGFAEECTFEGFDFTFNEEVLPSAFIRDLASCHFIEQKRNLTLAGPPGIGKSFISQAIGYAVCKREKDVIFRKVSSLLLELSDKENLKRTNRLFKKVLSADLLILDDFALQKYSAAEAELLYTIADYRLGKGSIILTSNRPPEDWYRVFPDPVVGGVILDRLISGSIKLITTKGRSYRKDVLGKHQNFIDREDDETL